MKSNAVWFIAVVAWAAGAGIAFATARDVDQQATIAKYRSILKSLHPVRGDVAVPGTDVILHLGNNYEYLDAASAKRVLVEGWGNPPDAVTGELGMVFPAGKTFIDDTWGAVITFENSGYVTDETVNQDEYDKFIKDLQSGEDKTNQERKTNGFPAEHLVGWAQPPSYDRASHTLIWARDLKFGDQVDDTLNYDVRLLGRRGVLSLNMVSQMSKLADTRAVAQDFGRRASFNVGARYTDFKSGDTKSGYGLAGLVAAGLGLAAAKKFGLLAIIALFGKKLFIFIAAGLAALSGRIRKFFGLKPKLQAAGASTGAAADAATPPAPLVTGGPATGDKPGSIVS